MDILTGNGNRENPRVELRFNLLTVFVNESIATLSLIVASGKIVIEIVRKHSVTMIFAVPV